VLGLSDYGDHVAITRDHGDFLPLLTLCHFGAFPDILWKSFFTRSVAWSAAAPGCGELDFPG